MEGADDPNYYRSVDITFAAIFSVLILFNLL